MSEEKDTLLEMCQAAVDEFLSSEGTHFRQIDEEFVIKSVCQIVRQRVLMRDSGKKKRDYIRDLEKKVEQLTAQKEAEKNK